MSEAWLSAAELAAITLPGLPGTTQRITSRAKREGWPSRRRAGRGGGREYPTSALPAEARAALAERNAAALAPAVAEEMRQASDLRDLAGWQREALEARLYILNQVELMAHAMGRRNAQDRFVAMAEAGELESGLVALIGKAHKAQRDDRLISVSTLRRWRRSLERGGELALAPKGKPAAYSPGETDTPVEWRDRHAYRPWLDDFLGYYLRPSKPSVAEAYERMAAEQPGALPGLRVVQQTIAGLGELGRNRGRMGPRELKTLKAHVVRDSATLQPADIYTADGHRADFEVLHPDTGRPFRPEIVSVLDVKTRRCVGWSAGSDENGWLVTDALRQSSTLAIPAIFYVDNGCGFKNATLDGGGAPGMLGRLGVTKKHSLPYNSQARGLVERFHRSVWVKAGKTLPTFVGADMDAEAKQRVFQRSRKALKETGGSPLHMRWPEFVAWGEGIVAAYNARPHSALAKTTDPETGRRRYMTPDEAWAADEAAGWIAERPDPDIIDDLFRPYETRQVIRGQVTLFSNTYFAPELERRDLNKRSVRVGYDLHDASRVWIRDMDDRLVCVAELDGNRHAYMPTETVAEARQRRRETGRLNRLNAKRDAVLAERGPPQLEHASNVEILNVPIRRAGESSALPDAQPDWMEDAVEDFERAAGE